MARHRTGLVRHHSSVKRVQGTGRGASRRGVALPFPHRSLAAAADSCRVATPSASHAPAMRQVVAAGHQVVIVGPPKCPHLPGLRFAGLDERQLVWIQAEAPAERLWVTEQLIKTNSAGLLVSWLPQARQEQIRRLQVCAQACDGPVFLCRPAAAEHEPSAAPLRVQLRFGLDWELHVHLLKRKGPTHEGELTLSSVPGGLESIITPRLRKPSEFIAARRLREREASHVVGSASPQLSPVRRVAAQ